MAPVDKLSATAIVTHEDIYKHCPETEFETAERIRAIYENIRLEKLLDHCVLLNGMDASGSGYEQLCHSTSYMTNLQLLCEQLGALKTRPHSERHSERLSKLKLRDLAKGLASSNIAYSDCDINASTYRSAHTAVNCVITACDYVLEDAQGFNRNAFVVVRPPGHHALRDAYSGFCFFNNVGIGLLHAIKTKNLERVLIIDWDVHHGDGTQSIIESLSPEDKARLLFVSIHRYHGEEFFPSSGNFGQVASESDLGCVVNIPLTPTFDHQMNSITTYGDREYLQLFKEVVLPLIKIKWAGKGPQLTLVSCGFDSAYGDRIGEFKLSSSGYAGLTNILSEITEAGRLVMLTEGGYTPSVNAACSEACVRALMMASHDKIGLAKDACVVYELTNECVSLFNFLSIESKILTFETAKKVLAIHQPALAEQPPSDVADLDVLFKEKLDIGSNP